MTSGRAPVGATVKVQLVHHVTVSLYNSIIGKSIINTKALFGAKHRILEFGMHNLTGHPNIHLYS